jgi:hypothetical protein
VASDRFDVSKPALFKQGEVNKCHGGQIGLPTVWTDKEEVLLVEHIQLLAIWGFPFYGLRTCAILFRTCAILLRLLGQIGN